MDTAVWIVAALLAALFLVTGLAKITRPRLEMAEGPMNWAAGVTDGQFHIVGVLELLGAAGLILPTVLGIAPALVPLAAVGLALTMVGAIVAHLRLGETDRLAVPIVVLALALFVVVEGFGAYHL